MTAIYIVDAFTQTRFGGNPAAVMVLNDWPEDALLQAAAAENNLSETAFIIRDGADWQLRWFTPTVEVPLCGHATLASAWVIFNRLTPDAERITFQTRQKGALHITRRGDDLVMDFPADPPMKDSADFSGILGVHPLETLKATVGYLVVLETAEQVRQLAPDFAALRALTSLDLIVTAPGDQDYDMVSRFFAPAIGIDEDPVTGAAHCALAPYWSQRLGKDKLHAYQASARGGSMYCQIRGDRVELTGQCVLWLSGEVDGGLQ